MKTLNSVLLINLIALVHILGCSKGKNNDQPGFVMNPNAAQMCINPNQIIAGNSYGNMGYNNPGYPNTGGVIPNTGYPGLGSFCYYNSYNPVCNPQVNPYGTGTWNGNVNGYGNVNMGTGTIVCDNQKIVDYCQYVKASCGKLNNNYQEANSSNCKLGMQEFVNRNSGINCVNPQTGEIINSNNLNVEIQSLGSRGL